MYEDTLMALSRDMRFRCSKMPESPVSERRNPACGDEIWLKAELSGGLIGHLQFYAQACAITLASASAMCELLNGQSTEQARERIEEVFSYLNGEEEWPHAWGKESLPALGAVRARPMRLACVRLPWEAMREALNSTE